MIPKHAKEPYVLCPHSSSWLPLLFLTFPQQLILRRHFHCLHKIANLHIGAPAGIDSVLVLEVSDCFVVSDLSHAPFIGARTLTAHLMIVVRGPSGFVRHIAMGKVNTNQAV